MALPTKCFSFRNHKKSIRMVCILKDKVIKRFKNIKELLYHSAKIYADNVAFTVKNKSKEGIKYTEHTYLDLLNDINCFGTALHKLGLKEKRVAVIGHNCYEWAVAHLANLMGDIVSVPLDKGLQIGELESSLIRSKVEAVVFDHKLKDIIREIKVVEVLLNN